MKLVSGLLKILVHGYRFLLSPVIGPCCRFMPSCSEYALEALTIYPVWKALPKILWRVLRCHPWGGHGFDPVVSDSCSAVRPRYVRPTHSHLYES